MGVEIERRRDEPFVGRGGVAKAVGLDVAEGTAFGLIVLVYVIGRYLIQGGSVPGFPFLASIVAVFSGAQLFALGIIGEYLARIHFRMMDRPAYVVRTVAESEVVSIRQQALEEL